MCQILAVTRKRIMRQILAVTVIAIQGSAVVGAEASSDRTVDEVKRARELIEQLAADDFKARAEADQALRKMSLAVVPALEAAAKGASTREVRMRSKRIARALVLEKEEDPAALAKHAREEALAEQYAEAAPFYAKAAKRFREAAREKTGDEAAKMRTEAESAARREARAKRKADVDAAGRRVRSGMGGGVGMGSGRSDPSSGSDEDDW